MRDIDRISGDVLDAAIQLHREVGPGLLESVYETVLAGQLHRLLINFGGATLKEGFRRLVNSYDPSASLRLCAKPITE